MWWNAPRGFFMTTTILIADDHKLMRQGLHSLIEEQPDMTVVGQAENGKVAVELAAKLSPQVVLMDISMPGLGGVDATRQIVATNGEAKIIGLSMYMEKGVVLDMLHAGATGYLLKDCAFEEVAAAVRTVVAGRTYLSPQISDVLYKDILHHIPTNDRSSCAALTERELAVLELLAEGKTTKEIAEMLNVSVKTVDLDRRQVMSKLNISTATELVKFSLRIGLTTLNPERKAHKNS